MNDHAPPSPGVRIALETPEETTRLARWLGRKLRAGDTLLLEGPIGAGKSHFCRGLIQSRLAALGRVEDVPSPSFTLVQVYDAGPVEIWHADLYRLGDPAEVWELGLDDAFGQAICLVEWPDRLGPARPAGALSLTLVPGAEETGRDALLGSDDPRWHDLLEALAQGAWRGDD